MADDRRLVREEKKNGADKEAFSVSGCQATSSGSSKASFGDEEEIVIVTVVAVQKRVRGRQPRFASSLIRVTASCPAAAAVRS